MKKLINILLVTSCFMLFINACHLRNQETKTSNQTAVISDEAEPDDKAPARSAPKTSGDNSLMGAFSPDTLVGRWLRPDGNYIIQIDEIKENKTLEARYFNPRPIHIARAEILPAEGLRIFIEFNDLGYEGSSYDLIYDPVNDLLTGNYFQATYGQTYQVGFIRMDN